MHAEMAKPAQRDDVDSYIEPAAAAHTSGVNVVGIAGTGPGAADLAKAGGAKLVQQ